MLIDNKHKAEDNIITLWEFFEKNTKNGDFDLVSAYFSIPALALLHDEMKEIKAFRLILSEIVADKRKGEHTLNLLAENSSIEDSVNNKSTAAKAIAFLKSDSVKVKSVEPNFCHAKLYLHKSDLRNSYFVLGSSNLTYAGLGLKKTSNIELNTVHLSLDSSFKEARDWFQQLWANVAKEEVILEEKKEPYKDYLIRQIEQFFKKYSPEELYYKTLFELFKDEFESIEAEAITNVHIGHLKDTVLYNELYEFQKAGVTSLIRKIQKYNGAILADAVGLGKTWQALAVMKFFELNGYKVILICPKKLEQNWRKYLPEHDSKFKADRLSFVIRYHTDLQEERLEQKEDKLSIKRYFQQNAKVLFVIDESHNLRNDKSSRYKFLVDELLQKNKDVKVLLLSATPINNHLTDVRNQFKLLAKGDDDGFKDLPLEVKSLEVIFRTAQHEFQQWQKLKEPTIGQFIEKLPSKFFELTDALIVARTRKQIEGKANNLTFPKKQAPQNEYLEVENIGVLKSFNAILDALKINMIAYRPTQFTDASKAKSVLDDNIKREEFLVKMMYILLVKRLESSWFSFHKTVDNIYKHHKNALEKVEDFIKNKKLNISLDNTPPISEEDAEEVNQMVENSFTNPKKNNGDPLKATLGKKKPIAIAEITHLESFRTYLIQDLEQLDFLKTQLETFNEQFQKELSSAEKKKSKDTKLQKLMQLIEAKQKSKNKKVIIFTAFSDTAKYLFDQLKARGFQRLGLITGSHWETTAKIKVHKNSFEPILEAFAPYTKLFNERNWKTLYKQENQNFDEKNLKTFEVWKKFIVQKDQEVKLFLENPVDILVATDCISEGQNLQDCDLVINYDIHWNPVRLIQRFGRIDRIGSPNKIIKGVNFWPGRSYDDFLNLKSRVEERLALFSLVGSEFDEKITPELAKKIKDFPIVDEQDQKRLEQMQTSWEGIEDGEQSVGLDKLSLEEFRQDLFSFFQKNKEKLEKIPAGVYSGFKAKNEIGKIPNGTIALLRYDPEKDEDLLRETVAYRKRTKKTEELFLIYTSPNGETKFINQPDILRILRAHKEEQRFVPDEIDAGNNAALQGIIHQIQLWLDAKAGRQAIANIQNLFNTGISANAKPKNKEELLLEKKFQKQNFELLTWFTVTGV